MLPPVQCLMQIRGVGLHNLRTIQAVRLSPQDGVHHLVHPRAKPKHEFLRAVEPMRTQNSPEHEGIVSGVEQFRIQIGELQHGAIGR